MISSERIIAAWCYITFTILYIMYIYIRGEAWTYELAIFPWERHWTVGVTLTPSWKYELNTSPVYWHNDSEWSVFSFKHFETFSNIVWSAFDTAMSLWMGRIRLLNKRCGIRLLFLQLRPIVLSLKTHCIKYFAFHLWHLFQSMPVEGHYMSIYQVMQAKKSAWDRSWPGQQRWLKVHTNIHMQQNVAGAIYKKKTLFTRNSICKMIDLDNH